MNTHCKLSIKVLLQDWWDITEYSEAFQPFHWLHTLILIDVSAHSQVCHISLSLWFVGECGHSHSGGVYHSGWCGCHYCRWQNGFLLVINIYIRCDGLENNANAHKNHKCYFLGFLKWKNRACGMCVWSVTYNKHTAEEHLHKTHLLASPNKRLHNCDCACSTN